MELKLHPEVKDDLKKLDFKIRSEATEWLFKLEKNANLGEPLDYELKGARKIYFNKAKHRIIYKVNKKKVQILVVAIGARKDYEVYNLAKRRLKQMNGR